MAGMYRIRSLLVALSLMRGRRERGWDTHLMLFSRVRVAPARWSGQPSGSEKRGSETHRQCYATSPYTYSAHNPRSHLYTDTHILPQPAFRSPSVRSQPRAIMIQVRQAASFTVSRIAPILMLRRSSSYPDPRCASRRAVFDSRCAIIYAGEKG